MRSVTGPFAATAARVALSFASNLLTAVLSIAVRRRCAVCAHARFVPVMRLKRRAQVPLRRRGIDGLIEAEQDDERRTRAAAAAIGDRAQQLDRRRREAERVGLGERPSADRRRRGIDRHLVLGGERQRRLGIGVKIRMVVPDHRKVPAIAGAIRTYGGLTTAGMRPSVTIGSEKTMRISFASARLAISPSGPALTIVRFGPLRAGG